LQIFRRNLISLWTGQIQQSQAAITAGNAVTVTIDKNSDVQSLHIKGGGFELAINAESEREVPISYSQLSC